MTDDRRVMQLLGEVLDDFPTRAPDRLLAVVLEDLGTASQGGRRRLTIPRARRPWTRSAVARLAVAASIAAVVVGVAWTQFGPRMTVVGPASSATPTPASSVGLTATARAGISLPPGTLAIEDAGQALLPGVRYTSRLFEPRITFQMDPRSPGTTSPEWCTPIATSPRMIAFTHARMCKEGLRYVRPFEVACGSAVGHPNAAALAAALVVGWGDTDVDTLDHPAGSLPETMFAEPYDRRVIRLDGLGAARTAARPCRFLPEPGSGDPIIDLHDRSATLVLLDVGDELVAILADGVDPSHYLEINDDLQFEWAEEGKEPATP